VGRRIKIYISSFLILVLISCEEGFIEYELLGAEVICHELKEVCDDFTITIDSSRSGRKVLIIGIDAFRSDAMQAGITPFLHEFSGRKTTYYTNRHQVQRLTFSGPNWSSLLTGVNWCKHQVTKNDFSNNRLDEFPHFFKYIEEADSSITTVSIVRWNPINDNITSNYADYAVLGSDFVVFKQARDMLVNQDPIDPDILFMHFVDLDAAGHEFGYHPDIPEYANTLTTMDEYVSSLVSIIETKRMDGEDWMIFVVSDHGGEGKGHHDYDNENNKYTIFFANHPDVEFIRLHTSSQVDLAPTILYFMGITSSEFDCKKDGISLIY